MPLNIFRRDGYDFIDLKGRADIENAAALGARLPEFLELPQHLVVDCRGIEDFRSSFVRALRSLTLELKRHGKHVQLISVSPALRHFFKINGLDVTFRVAENISEALQKVSPSARKPLDVGFINPFLAATLEVLKVQCGTEARAGKPFSKSPNEKFVGDISGVIGLVSETFSGSVVVSFPKDTFLKIVSRMLGEEITEITPETQDGAGELTNIIFGRAKIGLNERGYAIRTAIPSVVAGRDHTILQMTRGPRMVIPFETDVGSFMIEICCSE